MPPQSFGSRSVPNREGVAHVIACKESRYRKVGIDIRWLGERGLAFHKSPTKEKNPNAAKINIIRSGGSSGKRLLRSI